MVTFRWEGREFVRERETKKKWPQFHSTFFVDIGGGACGIILSNEYVQLTNPLSTPFFSFLLFGLVSKIGDWTPFNGKDKLLLLTSGMLEEHKKVPKKNVPAYTEAQLIGRSFPMRSYIVLFPNEQKIASPRFISFSPLPHVPKQNITLSPLPHINPLISHFPPNF